MLIKMLTSRTVNIALLVIVSLTHNRMLRAEDSPATHYLDIAQAANHGFADETAGDGKGGWSDQGPNNDFREFDVKATQFGGVPFRIIDPAANNGRAVMAFRHEQYLTSGLSSVKIDMPKDSRGRYLYLLHTVCWSGQSQGQNVGIIKVAPRQGESITLAVQSRRDVADWWNPGRLPNGVVAVAKPNQSAQVGVYLSRFDLGATTDVQSVTFETMGKSLWIVVAATLTDRDIPLAAAKGMSITADADWRPLVQSDFAVRPGTALDFSSFVDHAPAGIRGRVIARPDGTLCFADQPDKPVRFFVASGFPTSNPENIDAWADTIARQGYNMVRLHFYDQFVANQRKWWGKTLSVQGQQDFDRDVAAGKPFLDPASTDMMDRFVAALKKRGVYLYFDAMSSWAGCYPANCWYSGNGVENMKARLYHDPVARQHWHNTVKHIMTRINPYTGTSLATDPQVAVVLGVNEPTLFINVAGSERRLLPLWRAYLAKKFGTVAAYNQSWNPGTPAVRFDQIPFFAPNDVWHSARSKTVTLFVSELEEETAAWMKNELRSFGYQGLYSHYDWLYNLRLYLPRAQAGVVSMHGYCDHPQFIGNTLRMAHISSLADGLNWWRSMLAQRISGQPLAMMEYGQVYFNRHRYEEGLAVGAYGSFQDVCMLTAHSWPVALKQEPLGAFNVGTDPVARASQVVTGALYMQRAVAVAPHRVDIPLSRDLAIEHGERAISGDQSRIALLTGFATAVEGKSSSVPATLQLPLTDGAKTIDAAFYSSVVDTQGGTFGAAVASLRSAGILPPGNRTDPAKKIYETETGQILLDAGSQRLVVNTPTVAGLCATRYEGPVSAGGLTVQSASASSSVSLISRDEKPLGASGRLLLVIATDAHNTGDTYSDSEGATLTKRGELPVLMRTGRFTIDITRDSSAPQLKAWVLAMDGSRRDMLATKNLQGAIRLEVDTGAWADGVSPFVELSEK